MAELLFDPDADRALTALERDTRRAQLAAAVEAVLAALDEDPGQAWLRRHRFDIGLWCVVVAGDGEEWAILWEPAGEGADDVIVHYVGPASFA